jgi:hypothetical protein
MNNTVFLILRSSKMCRFMSKNVEKKFFSLSEKFYKKKKCFWEKTFKKKTIFLIEK